MPRKPKSQPPQSEQNPQSSKDNQSEQKPKRSRKQSKPQPQPVPVYLVKMELMVPPEDLSLAWLYMTNQVNKVPKRIERLVDEHWDLLNGMLKQQWKLQEKLGIH